MWAEKNELDPSWNVEILTSEYFDANPPFTQILAAHVISNVTFLPNNDSFIGSQRTIEGFCMAEENLNDISQVLHYAISPLHFYVFERIVVGLLLTLLRNATA